MGIAFSPDEKSLYVSDSVTDEVLAFPPARFRDDPRGRHL
jgi:sugar lactone lactonase YvrE